MRLTGLPTGFENEGVWVSLPTVPDVLPSGGANGGQIRVSRDRARGPSATERLMKIHHSQVAYVPVHR